MVRSGFGYRQKEKVELLGFVDSLDVGCERKRGVKKDFKISVLVVGKIEVLLVLLGKMAGGVDFVGYSQEFSFGYVRFEMLWLGFKW